jgi:predicted RNA-binding protein with PIN domain
MATAKREYLLVDGYNIIFAWKELAAAAEYSLEHARARLMDILSDFKGFTGYEIILVFDSHRVEKSLENVEKYVNITVVYTQEAETADGYIERTANKLVKRDNVIVATSDSLEQIIIMSRGARRITAAALFDQVQLTKKTIRNYTQKRPVKNNMLLDNMDVDTAEKLEQMRRNG